MKVAVVAGSALVLSLVSAPGCAFLVREKTDHPIPPAQVAKVQKGMTKGEVAEILGAPQEIIFSNREHDPLREHAYVYEYKVQAGTAIFLAVVNFGNLDEKRDRVIVFFGDDEKVTHVAKSLNADMAHYGFPFGR